EIWGAPTSKPARDPHNPNFIYQRFQRGIMHYDKGCSCTQGLLLADYFKALLMGQNVPADLAAQARESRFFKQYDRHKANGLVRPSDLPRTDLSQAFDKQAPVPQAQSAPQPVPPPPPAPVWMQASQQTTRQASFGWAWHRPGPRSSSSKCSKGRSYTSRIRSLAVVSGWTRRTLARSARPRADRCRAAGGARWWSTAPTCALDRAPARPCLGQCRLAAPSW